MLEVFRGFVNSLAIFAANLC